MVYELNDGDDDAVAAITATVFATLLSLLLAFCICVTEKLFAKSKFNKSFQYVTYSK